MGFGGVDTGSMNPKDAAKVAASAGTNGLMPAPTATGATTGTTPAADAGGAVAAGAMAPEDAAEAAASAGTNGVMPAATATGMTIGTTTAADAVLLVVSEMMIARITAKIVMANVLVSPRVSAEALPIVSARPVSASSDPKMMPVPKSRTVPQSIVAASDQLRVNSRRFQSVGSRNSSDAARTARGPPCIP